MNDKELVITFKWTGDVGNLLPTEINRIVASCAEQMNKTAGKSITAATYLFQGKDHNVPIKDLVGA